MSVNPTSRFLTDSQGIASDTAYVVTASSGGGIFAADLGGTDSLSFTDAFPTLAKRTPGIMGFDRFLTDLYIDLNRDGSFVWTEDLLIRDFFADSSSPLPGRGFIETIGNLSGTDILDLDLLDYVPGSPGNDRLFGLGGSNYLTGGDGDDTYIIKALDGGHSSILDTSGTDTLIFTDAFPALEKMTFGVLGLGRFSTTLVVDLNRDGEFVGTNDLMIHDFFADSTNVPGNGFIETIGNFSGTDILKLDFSTYFLGSDSSDTLFGEPRLIEF